MMRRHSRTLVKSALARPEQMSKSEGSEDAVIEVLLGESEKKAKERG